MLHISCDVSSTFAIAFASLSAWSHHSIRTHTSNHSASILGGHITFHPASSVGRMDCFGSHDSYPGKWYCHMRNAKNFGEQEGSKEEDS